jgi:PAS domain S-box-containing protein
VTIGGDVGWRIADAARRFCRVQAAAIFQRWDAESDDLVSIAVSGDVGPTEDGRLSLPHGTGLAGLAVRARGPIASPDVLLDPRVTHTPEAWRRLAATTARAVLAVPLILQERVIGALAVADHVGRCFDRQEVELALIFAGQVALTLENMWLCRQAARREREFAEQWGLLRTAMENLAQGVSVVDRDLRLVAWNTRFLDLLGFPREFGQVGRPFEDFIRYNAERGEYGPGRPDEQTRERVALARRFAPHCFERVRPDGTVVEVRGGPMPAGGFVTTYTDVTERRRSEQALQRSQARYRAIVEDQTELVCRWTSDGRLTFFNDTYRRCAGRTPDELMGAQFMALPLSTLPSREQPVVSFEQQVALPSGEVRWQHWTTRAILDASGRTVEFQSVGQDTTERKRAELALRRSEEQLRHAQKMEAVGRLAGGVAHDFNNLLTVITGRGEMLLRGLEGDQRLRRHAECIQETGGRATELVRQLLAFSRKQRLTPKVLDLNAVVAGMERMLRRLIGEHIELKGRYEADLWRVKADPGQLEQVIVNLVVNARDAMPDGGVLTLETGNVELDAAFAESHLGASPGPHVLLAVTDTGVGIDAETRSHLFEPFFTTKGPGKGTGLGLATVYGIVKQSGGHVSVDSEPGQGARFGVYLPRVDAPIDPPPPAAAGAPPSGGSETILLVEDQEEVRALAREVLQVSGYRVLEAANGPAAVAEATRHAGQIDLLLTDVVMPQMNGRELADRLGRVRPEMGVLYMSGYSDGALVARGALDARAPLLPKPFTSDVLATRVREFLDRRRTPRVAFAH